MTIKSEKSGEGKARLSLCMKCGDCIHFKRGPKRFEKLCKDLKITAGSKACSEFTPDIYKINKVGGPQFARDLGLIVKDFKGSHFRILSFIFRNLNFIAKTGFRFGQPVYVNLAKEKYECVQSYFKGYVIGASPSGEYLYITSKIGKQSATYIYAYPATVLTWKQFKKRSAKLIKEEKIKLPDTKKGVVLKAPEIKKVVKDKNLDRYNVPTLENAPEEWLQRAQDTGDEIDWYRRAKKSKGKLKIKKKGDDTYVEI